MIRLINIKSSDNYSVTYSYRRNIFAGYISILLILIGSNLMHVFYVYLNLNWQIILSIITLIPGFILWVYFFVGFIKIMIDLRKNPQLIKNKSKLRIHYLLIWSLNIIWILIGHFIYNLNLTGLLIPTISILLLFK